MSKLNSVHAISSSFALYFERTQQVTCLLMLYKGLSGLSFKINNKLCGGFILQKQHVFIVKIKSNSCK